MLVMHVSRPQYYRRRESLQVVPFAMSYALTEEQVFGSALDSTQIE